MFCGFVKKVLNRRFQSCSLQLNQVVKGNKGTPGSIKNRDKEQG